MTVWCIMNRGLKRSLWLWQLSDKIHESTSGLINLLPHCASQHVNFCEHAGAGCGHWSEPCDGASQVNCPWNSIVNLCCFDGCVFYSRSVDTNKQIIPAHCIYSAQMKSSLINKQRFCSACCTFKPVCFITMALARGPENTAPCVTVSIQPT